MLNNYFFFENRAVCKICGAILYSQTGHRWQYCTARQATDGNIVQPDRPQMAILYSQTGHRWQYNTGILFVCWLPQARNTLSEYVIFMAFPMQQWLHEQVSELRYIDTACLGTISAHTK